MLIDVHESMRKYKSKSAAPPIAHPMGPETVAAVAAAPIPPRRPAMLPEIVKAPVAATRPMLPDVAKAVTKGEYDAPCFLNSLWKSV